MRNFKSIAVRTLSVIMTVAVLILSLSSCGKNISETEAMRTEHFSVNDAMMSYTLYDTYYYYVNAYGSEMMIYYFGLDTSKSLKDQYYNESTGTTWFDTFLDIAQDSFKSALVLCEAAYDSGLSLSDVDNKFIDSEIAEIRSAAEEAGMTLEKFIVANYGKGVTSDDIRKSLEIYRLANKEYYSLYTGTEVSDAEIDKYVLENPADFNKRDVKRIRLTRSDDEAVEAKIKEYAEKIATATSVETFDTLANEFLGTEYNISDKNKIETQNCDYSDVSAADKWMFSSDTAINDTFIAEEDSYYMVYIAVSDIYKITLETRNMYHILFSPDIYDSEENSKLMAESVYDTWKNGDKSVESFKELAVQYSADYVSIPSGGYYPNLSSEDISTEIATWLFDEERKAGDTEIVKSQSGYHIIYYSGTGLEQWKATATEAVKNEKLKDIVTALSETYKVTLFEDNWKYIKGI